MLSKQRILQYFQQHRIVSIITGHIVVVTILVITLFGHSFGNALTGVFAQRSCPTGDQTHTVLEGETLNGIAISHGTTWQKLAQSNSISNPNLIYSGQLLCLPSAPTTLASSNTASPTSTIHDVFGADASAAMHVATCESSLNPNAVNQISISGSHAEGLFQILYPSTWQGTSQAPMSPFDARANAIAAHDIFVRDGHSWKEWSCQP